MGWYMYYKIHLEYPIEDFDSIDGLCDKIEYNKCKDPSSLYIAIKYGNSDDIDGVVEMLNEKFNCGGTVISMNTDELMLNKKKTKKTLLELPTGQLVLMFHNKALSVTSQKSYEEEVKEMEGILDAYCKNILILTERTRKVDVYRKRRKM